MRPRVSLYSFYIWMTYFFRSSKKYSLSISLRSNQLDTKVEEMRTTNCEMLQIWQRKQKHWGENLTPERAKTEVIESCGHIWKERNNLNSSVEIDIRVLKKIEFKMAIYRVIYHSSFLKRSLGLHEILQIEHPTVRDESLSQGFETRWGPVSTAVRAGCPSPGGGTSGHRAQGPSVEGVMCPQARQDGRCPSLTGHLFCVQHVAQGSVETRLGAWHTVVAEWPS